MRIKCLVIQGIQNLFENIDGDLITRHFCVPQKKFYSLIKSLKNKKEEEKKRFVLTHSFASFISFGLLPIHNFILRMWFKIPNFAEKQEKVCFFSKTQ